MTDLEPAPTRKLSRLRLILLAALPAAAIIAVAAGVADYARLETLNAYRHELLAYVAAHRALAVLTFAGVYFAGVALGIPGWGLLTVASGFLFGPVLGTIIVVISATAGGTVLFLAARYALGDILRARAAPVLRKLEAGFKQDAFSYMLALRFVPVLPFFLTTLAAAFLGIHTRPFVMATALGIIPVTVVYATLGAGLGDALEAGVRDPLAAAREPTVIGGLFGLAALAILPVAYKRFAGRKPLSRAGDE